ncbi:MAG: heteropolysaccharide repeat-containing protein [Parcubacteria group bacterium Gr01-1014_106]|nr:MAG: heteropolysaccharide repeat-containing protein [Parcubacteria group bacterium Gr01-1014_106]
MLPPQLLSGTLVSTVGRVLGTLLSVLTIGIVTRGLAHEGGVGAYGTYATIFAFLAVVSIIADGGLYLVFTRRAAQEDPADEARLLLSVLRLRAISFAGALVLLVIVMSVLPYLPLVRMGILLGAIGIGSQLIVQLLLGVFQKRLRMVSPAVAEVCGRAGTLLLALLIRASDGGILAYVGAFVVGTLITLLITTGAVWRMLPAPASKDRVPSRTLLREAWPMGALLLCWMIVFRADSVLLSLLRPPEELGWYALPYKVLESLLFFPAMIGGLLLPAFSRTAAMERERLPASLTAATHLFFLLALPVVLILFLAAPWMITILGGAAFAPSIGVLRILALALGALFFGNLYGNGAIALGQHRRLLWGAATLAVLNVLVNSVIIPRYSFLGAAWTTLGTEILSAGFAARIVWSRARFSILSSTNLHIASAGGAFVLVSLLPIPLLLRIIGGSCVYLGALWMLGVLTPRRVWDLVRAQRSFDAFRVGVS